MFDAPLRFRRVTVIRTEMGGSISLIAWLYRDAGHNLYKYDVVITTGGKLREFMKAIDMNLNGNSGFHMSRGRAKRYIKVAKAKLKNAENAFAKYIK